MAAEIGAARTGIRLSPITTFSDTARDSNPQALYGRLVEVLAPLGLAFVHMIEGETGGPREPADLAQPFDYDALKKAFGGGWIVNNGFDRASAEAKMGAGAADAIAFGKPFIANPDLVRRLRENAPLNALRAELMYGGGAEGYIDYPALA